MRISGITYVSRKSHKLRNLIIILIILTAAAAAVMYFVPEAFDFVKSLWDSFVKILPF